MSTWGQVVTEDCGEEQSTKGERRQLGREGWEQMLWHSGSN